MAHIDSRSPVCAVCVCSAQAIYWRFISKVRPEDLYRHDALPDMVRARAWRVARCCGNSPT